MIIILIADQLSNMPATITSRCQTIHFRAVDSQLAANWLESESFVELELDTPELFCRAGARHSQHSIPVAQSAINQLYLGLADHAPLFAKQLIDINYLNLRNQLLDFLMEIAQDRFNLSKVESFSKENLQWVFYVFYTLIIDLLRLQYAVNDGALFNFDCVSNLKLMLQRINSNRLAQLSTIIIDSYGMWVRQANLNWQLCLENIFLEWEKAYAG